MWACKTEFFSVFRCRALEGSKRIPWGLIGCHRGLDDDGDDDDDDDDDDGDHDDDHHHHDHEVL